MSLLLLRQLVPLVGSDLVPQFEIERYELLILLADDLLIAGEEVHLIEVSKLVGQGLSEQLVVVLRRGDVLREDSFFLQPGIHVLLVEPVVRALVFHDLEDPAPVDFTQVLVVEVLVEAGRVVAVSRPPPVLILEEAIGVGENLLPEAALPLLMLAGDELVVLAEVLVLDLVLILLGLEVHLPPGAAQCVLVLLVGGSCGGDDSRLAGVVEHAERTHHN